MSPSKKTNISFTVKNVSYLVTECATHCPNMFHKMSQTVSHTLANLSLIVTRSVQHTVSQHGKQGWKQLMLQSADSSSILGEVSRLSSQTIFIVRQHICHCETL